MIQYFAHAGEHHDTMVEAARHSILTDWYTALPIYFIVLALIAYVSYIIFKKSVSSVLSVLPVVLLIAGIAGYTISPPISIFSIAIGFGLVLFKVLVGLSKQK